MMIEPVSYLCILKMAAATRKKKVNKNRKKNWRKHVNITSIEDYLEDKRLQERTTGGVVSEKEDEALFFIEKTVVKSEESKNKKRRPTKDEPLKCYQNLLPDSTVPIPIAPRTNSTKLLKTIKKESDKKLKQIVKRSRDNKTRTKTKDGMLDDGGTATYDVWGDAAKEILFKRKFGVKGKVNVNDDEHFLRQTKKKDVKVPNTPTFSMKPSALASVEVPHPGASYNPTFDDHQELLSAALKIEEIKKKKDEKLHRATTLQIPRGLDAPTEASYLKEMSVGIYADDAEEDMEEVDVSGGVSYNPPTRREDKKTRTQRNKEKRHKLLLEKIEKTKTQKKEKQQLFELRKITKEVHSRVQNLSAAQAKRAVKKANSAYQTKKLGNQKYEAPDVELKLSHELEGSLRRLRPEGDLLQDRFKSLQRRNLIEPRGRAKFKRKYKLKKLEKKTHKEIVL